MANFCVIHKKSTHQHWLHLLHLPLTISELACT